MHSIKQDRAVTGSAMDTIVPRRNGRSVVLAALGVLFAIVIAIFAWQLIPRGLRVQANTVRTAKVQRGRFSNNIALRAVAASLNSVVLDAVDSGRVEEVVVKDGAIVKPGQILFRLSNPQRNLELLARESDYATQIANLANLQVGLESSKTARERRLMDLNFDVAQAEKQYLRDSRLAQQGFISSVELERSDDNLTQRRHLLTQEQAAESELRIKRNAIRQMQSSTERLASGLRLLNAGVDALSVRAPVGGQITDFHLQVGETVQHGQNVGRIDDPAEFKMVARVDEFYLNALAVGQGGRASIHDAAYPIGISRIYPQIKDGQFQVDIVFVKQPVNLSPGQSVDVELSLGASESALLLPVGTYVNESGAAGLFVLDPSGDGAQRRRIRMGRRNAMQVEILDGLQAGEQVIISGYAEFRDATRLQISD